MDLFKLHNNILGLGGREYLAWLSIWLWISLLAPKLKVDLERKYQETILSNIWYERAWWELYNTPFVFSIRCCMTSQWHHIRLTLSYCNKNNIKTTFLLWPLPFRGSWTLWACLFINWWLYAWSQQQFCIWKLK